MKKHVSIGIMLSLLSGKRVTASYLATKYETSIKTIYRAIDTLLEAGMPIRCIQGKNGGYELIKESVINSSFFTMKELSSFLSFIKTTNNLINKDTVFLEDRISNVFDQEIINEINEESKHLVIDLSMWGHSESNTKLISTVNECIKNKTKLEINYINIKAKKSTKRVIHPYSLVFKTDTWYVYAFCEKRNSFRLFKLSRIENINCIHEQFIKKQIDVLSKPWNKDFKNNLEEIDIELQCETMLINDVIDWLGDNSQIEIINEHPRFAYIKGKAYYSLGLVHKIIEFGDKIQILSPIKLKEAIVSECDNISSFYQRKNAFL